MLPENEGKYAKNSLDIFKRFPKLEEIFFEHLFPLTLFIVGQKSGLSEQFKKSTSRERIKIWLEKSLTELNNFINLEKISEDPFKFSEIFVLKSLKGMWPLLDIYQTPGLFVRSINEEPVFLTALLTQNSSIMYIAKRIIENNNLKFKLSEEDFIHENLFLNNPFSIELKKHLINSCKKVVEIYSIRKFLVSSKNYKHTFFINKNINLRFLFKHFFDLNNETLVNYINYVIDNSSLLTWNLSKKIKELALNLDKHEV